MVRSGSSALHRLAAALAAMGALAVAAPRLAAQTVVAIPCVADNTLYESLSGSLSNGSGVSVFVGVTGNDDARRAVLRFDVAGALPAGAKVLAATLSLLVAQSSDAQPIATTCHRLLQAFGEGASVAGTGGVGGGGGAPAQPGDATWLHTTFATSFWLNAGGDYAAVPSVTISLPTFGPVTSPPSPDFTADVQSFLDVPAQNFGWLLRTDEQLAFTARRIHSRENVGLGPVLTVTYLVPGQVGAWGSGCPVGAGTFGAAFVGAPLGGTAIQIAQTGAPALGIGTTFYSLALDAAGVALLPGCIVYLPLAQPLIPGSVFLTDGAGAAAQPFQVPLGYQGFLVVGQSIVLDNNPVGFVLSNAALACLL